MDLLVTRKPLTENTYESSLIKGLRNIGSNPYNRTLDRHIVLAIPNSLAIKEGSNANTFLKRAGKIKKATSAGVPVTVGSGQTFTNAKTGEEDTLILLDFEYTSDTNIDVVTNILNS